MDRKFTSHQIILLDRSGEIAYSCDSIFNVSKYVGKNIAFKIPFLESIFHKLLELDKHSEPIRFSRMENPFPELTGAYDFTFSYLPTKEANYILWSIYDYSELYKNVKDSQQKRNELEILRQEMIKKK